MKDKSVSSMHTILDEQKKEDANLDRWFADLDFSDKVAIREWYKKEA